MLSPSDFLPLRDKTMANPRPAQPLVIALAVLVPALASAPVPAADAAGPPASGGWQFSLTPYFWAAGLDGDVGVGGRTYVS
jgi:hypothetical protein